MLLERLKSNNLVHLIIIPVLGILLWARTFYLNYDGVELDLGTFHMPMYAFLINYLEANTFNLVISVIALLLIIAETFIVVDLANRYNFYERNNFLPGYIFIILASSYIGLQKLHPAIIANIFILIALEHLFRSIKVENSLKSSFYAALFISISSLFYIKAVVFILVCWLVIVFIRKLTFRDFIVSVFGFALPYFLSWAYFYLQNAGKEFTVTLGLTGVIKNMDYSLDLMYYIFFGFLALLILFASIHMLKNIRFKNIEVGNYFWALFFFFIVTLISYFLRPFSLEFIVIGAIPVAYLITEYLLHLKKSWVGDIILLALLVLTVSTCSGNLIPLSI